MKFFWLFLLTLCSSSAFAQTNYQCSQLGGHLPCKPAEVIYHINGKYGKNHQNLKTNLVASVCQNYAANANNLSSCTASPNIRVQDFNNSPSYVFTIFVEYDNDPAHVTTHGWGIGSIQPCPSTDDIIERLPGTWQYYCYPVSYISAYGSSSNAITKPISFGETKAPKPQMCTADSHQGASTVGDPIDITTGNKTLSEIDYQYNSTQEFIIKRDYSSILNDWTFYFNRKLDYSDTGTPTITLSRPGGQILIFTKNNNLWTQKNGNSSFSISENNNELVITSAQLDTETYEKIDENEYTKTYQLKTLTNYKGQSWQYNYDDGFVKEITDDYLRKYTFKYANDDCKKLGKFESITAPGNKIISYTYDYACRLNKVTYPDGKFKRYTYNGASNRLDTVIDENGNVSQKTTYNNSMKAISEGMGANGDIEKFSVNYQSNNVKITDANNNTSTVSTQVINGANKVTGYNEYCPWCNGYQGSNLTYDSNGYISGIKDYKNVDTGFTYNSKGKPLSTIQAVGTLKQRTTLYTYDTTGNFVTSNTVEVEGGNRVTSYTYNDFNQVTQVSVTAPNGLGGSITKNYSITYDNLGQATEFRGAKYSPIFNDKVTMTYNSQGQIATLTNALGHITTFNSYDDYGNPTQISMPNGTIQNMTYDLRGRMVSSSFKTNLGDAETTLYQYDNAGLITKITQPAGNYILMSYDTAHRLNKIEEYNETQNYQGKIEFTLDNMSNITAIKLFDKDSIQIRVSNAQYDTKNRLYKTIGSINQTSTQIYDSNSNATQLTDEGNYIYNKTYDNLNRLQSITNPDSGQINITYNPDDSIATVQDPKGLVTTYNYDGFGNRIKVTSPDAGITSYSYDLNNNIISKKDAKNNTTSYTYDVLNRVTSISNIDNNSTLNYDSCKIGKVCTITDNSGAIEYTYNNKARIATKKTTLTGFSNVFLMTYEYNAYGRILQITYPSITATSFNYTGSSFNYNYVNGKISSINKNTINLVDNIQYLPFDNEPKSFSMGTNNYSKVSSQDGLTQSISYAQPNSYSKDYLYDTRSNITAINEKSLPINKSLSAVYDSKGRIIGSGYAENGITPLSYGYNYNTTDDRTVATKASGTYNYSYPANSHKLVSISGANELTYDSNGNIISSGTGGVVDITFTYNASNRLSSSTSSLGTTVYTYNALGQRLKKVLTSGSDVTTTWFMYDESGKIIADYVNKNNIWTVSEYMYFENKPLAVIRNGELYHIQVDHLNTPRTITKASTNELVWSWENKEVFGNNLPNENIGFTMFKFNLRFMGQYWDEEKASSYNYYRDYAPGIGRYLQSDPIGLDGGINTYGYAGANSLSYNDPLGLLRKNSDGTLKFTVYNVDFVNNYVEGFLETDLGNSVKAYYYIGKNSFLKNYTTDCHGVSFTNGQYWINNEDVSQILIDEYIEVKNKQVGDIGIYYNKGLIDHSITVMPKFGIIDMVLEKDGTGPGPYFLPATSIRRNNQTIKYYRRK